MCANSLKVGGKIVGLLPIHEGKMTCDTVYTCQVDDSRSFKEYCVVFNDLVNLCKQSNLKLVEKMSFRDAYDHAASEMHELCKRMNATAMPRLEKGEVAVAFCFEKVDKQN